MKTYNKNCTVCRKLRKDLDFKEQIYASRYFVKGARGIGSIVSDFGNPFAKTSVYHCLKNHKGANARAPISGVSLPVLTNNDLIQDLVTTDNKDQHERTLDDIILAGDKLVKSGGLDITMTQLISAIKIQSDIKEKTKDRKMDAFKMFVGAAPKNGQSEG